MPAPDLGWSGSWIVLEVATGKPYIETFNRTTADRYSDTELTEGRFEVVPALQWLQRYNKAVVLACGNEPTKEQLEACK